MRGPWPDSVHLQSVSEEIDGERALDAHTVGVLSKNHDLDSIQGAIT
jgi:hypothetical protein